MSQTIDLTRKIDDLKSQTERRLIEQSTENKLHIADMNKRFTDAIKEDRRIAAEARKVDQANLIHLVDRIIQSNTENMIQTLRGESISPIQINGGTNADVSTL